MAYRLRDKDGNEIINLYLPRKCVLGSKFQNRNIIGMNQGVFKDCINLQSVEFEGPYWNSWGIQSEGNFENCTSLETLILNEESTIPQGSPNFLESNYSYIFEDTFKNCTSLKNINTENLTDKTKINFSGFYTLQNTGFIDFNISNVEMLRGLIDCQNLKTITTDAVIFGNFKNDSNLESITFNNKNIQQFPNQFFYGCSSLNEINFNGTIEEWMSIEKTNGWREELQWIPIEWADETYKVHCNDGDTPLVPIEAGLYKGLNFTNWQNLLDIGYVTVENGNITASSNSLDGNLVIDGSINNIYDNVFKDSSYLSGVDMRMSNIQNLGSEVFANSYILETVKFNNNTSTIGNSCFKNCVLLDNLDFTNTQLSTIGYAAFENCSSLKNITFNNETKLQSLGDSAFKGCYDLENIDLSNTEIEAINQETFMNCYSLNNIILSDTITTIGNSAFSGCNSLTSLDFKDNTNLNTLNDSCFLGCTGLSSFTLPNSITNIGDNIFSQCENLTELNFNGTMSEWEDIEKSENWNTDSSLIKVICIDGEINLQDEGMYGLYTEDGNFISWNSLNIDIEKNYTRSNFKTDSMSPYKVFNDNNYSGRLVIPDTITSIGDFAFYQSDYLTGIEFPNSITSIGMVCMAEMKNIEDIDLSNTQLEIISAGLFLNTTTLKNISLPNSLKTIKDSAFEGCINLEKISMYRTQVSTIGKSSFSECSKMLTVSFSNSLTSIGEFAFYGCNLLSYFNLGDTQLQQINDSAFRNCTSMTTFILPSSLNKIGNYVFGGCKKITDISSRGTVNQWNSISGISTPIWRHDSTISKVICMDGVINY